MKNIITLLAACLILASVAQAKSIGLVVAVQGTATATDSAGTSRALALSSEIFLNDSIQTGPASRLQLMLNDDSLVAQGENSEMTIDEYVYNPAQASDNAFGAKLGKGLFRTVTGKITDLNPDRFAVKTARATIGIRGCDVACNALPGGDNIFVMAIPEGKKIFIESLLGDQSLMVESPSFVTVDNRGMIQQRALTGADRSGAQRGTTPGAGGALGIDPAEAGIPGGDILSGGLTGGETLINQGSILQDTVQGEGHGQ